MRFPLSNRVLLQSMMASALVVAGATACSRADRTETGSDNTAAVTADTSNSAGEQTAASPTSDMSAASDTLDAASKKPETGAVAGDAAPAQVPSNAPRAATAPSPGQGADTAAAGYRAMERDTANMPESDSARVTADSSEISQTTDTNAVETANAALPSDSVATATDEDTAAAAGYVAMARDTGAAVDQTDTTASAADADAAVQASIDTSQVDGAIAADADVSANADVAAGAADTVDNAGRIRPPEDSTEILDQDSTEILGNVNSSETADEEPVAANEQDTSTDRETVAGSESQTDQVGAAAIGGTVTGAEAVALLTRAGVRCAVVDPEANEVVRWDMSSTPVTLNPCGMGSMVWSKIWAGVE